MTLYHIITIYREKHSCSLKTASQKKIKHLWHFEFVRLLYYVRSIIFWRLSDFLYRYKSSIFISFGLSTRGRVLRSTNIYKTVLLLLIFFFHVYKKLHLQRRLLIWYVRNIAFEINIVLYSTNRTYISHTK